MERRSSAKLGIALLVIIIAVVVIGGVVFLSHALFDDNKPQVESVNQSNLLTEPADDTAITMSVRGPVTAREYHYDIYLEVSANKRQLVIATGYDNPKEYKRIDLENDKGAFEDLRLALNNVGYTRKLNITTKKDDGLCPSGQLTTFGIKNGNESKHSAWTTSCGNEVGNFGGDVSEVIRLLLDQIPGSRQIIEDVKDL